MRINKFLARELAIARRKADALIEAGKVKINGKLSHLGQEVGACDVVEVLTDSWQRVEQKERVRRVVLMYKPTRFLVSSAPSEDKKTIYHLLPSEYKHLKPAGRLDYVSEGLLVLTSDGELIYNLTHPAHNQEKIYLVAVAEGLKQVQLTKLQKPFIIDGYKTKGARVEPLDTKKVVEEFGYLHIDPGRRWYKVTIHEGRNNQLRRMFGRVNAPVKRLIRIVQGPYTLTEEIVAKGFIQKE